MTYIQCNFCNSMVDADLYLLQICCTRIAADTFLNTVVDKFHIKEWMSLAPYQAPQNAYLEGEHDTPMLESFLTFLATLISVRTNLDARCVLKCSLLFVRVNCQLNQRLDGRPPKLNLVNSNFDMGLVFQMWLANPLSYCLANMSTLGH
ncbi:hypothetical protein NQ318_006768 [Aromia moschata]|uniref:E3 ubiquitin-protein ligase n=1 Tax=Aromia moschata TaxID=1265417 RepID=A0AAV8Y7F7_9CUCU|nr:hypothetical protein NQ318_006768 [Aromia moschata]